ncbi:MAG: flavin reductase family protein [Bacteroidetes bacterium]|nr:flavin reductase family protein [Bacteroidota bacterium]
MQKKINAEDINNFEQRYRATLINSLGGFKSLVLIGTRNKEGKSNLAIFNSFFHLGANPPLFGIIIRPDSVERHTLSNILETGVFTVNHVNEDFYKQAHQTSARYPADVSEFDAAGLTEENNPGIYAPFVKESSIKITASFRQKIDIEANGTIMIIGKINHISLPENCLSEDGFIDIEKAGTITCSGLDSYHTTKRLSRLTYAKPDKLPQEIN